MTVRDWRSELGPPDPEITLSIEDTEGGYIVVDQYQRRCTLTPMSMDAAVRFMVAMEARGHATVDEDSIIWHKLLLAGGHSVKAPDNVLPFRKATG